MDLRYTYRLGFALSAALWLSACGGKLFQIPYNTEPDEPEPTAIKVGLELGGANKFFKKWLDVEQIDISGMARLDNGDFFLIHDSKDSPAEQFRPRFGVLSIDEARKTSTYQEIQLSDRTWRKLGGPANDLEAICGLSQNPGEFLLLESSNYKGRDGRIFHVRLKQRGKKWKIKILGMASLPKQDEDEETPYNFEGMGCVQETEDRVEVVLGDRGEGKHRSRLFWNTLDLRKHRFLRGDRFKVLEYGIRAPVWETLGETDVRHISDLYIDKLGRMWIASAYDEGDFGPFASVVYMAGYASPGHILPVDWNPDPVFQVKIGGIKIEALGPALSDDCLLSVGTDDEGFGGQLGEIFCKDPEVKVYNKNLPTN
ncbi:hypothetical protein ACTRW9_09230 [Nitrospina sp. 32_T5]|uniref:hypothetical protein n=1 Tax=unclassified Nitrospina TaxID=2638683 RepID=UPI003F98C8E7